MAIPQTIKQLANDVRNKIYGKDVRESIAKGMEESGDIADNAKTTSEDAVDRVNIYKSQFDQSILDGDQPAEVQTLRVDPLTGETYATAADRFESNQKKAVKDLELNTQDYLSLTRSLEGGTSDKDVYDNLASLIEVVKASGKGLYIPNGKYYISDDLTIQGIRNIKIDGEIVMAPGKMLEIVFNSASSLSCQWHINRIEGKVRVAGLKNGETTVQHADELELFANRNDSLRSSIAYSKFHLGTINKLGIIGVNLGWINENEFFGGRLKYYVMDGDYNHNNNSFHKPMLEGFHAEVLSGGDNIFYDCRFEGENTFYFAEGTFNNWFRRSWSNFAGGYLRNHRPTLENNITDLGVSNGVVYSYDEIFEEKTIFEMNSHSSNFPVHRIQKKENSLEVISLEPTIFGTGLIRVDGDIGVLASTDNDIFRYIIRFYDENKNQITYDPSEYLSYLSMRWSGTQLSSPSNVYSLNLAIFKNSPIKYFDIRARIGPGVSGEEFQGLKIAIRHEKRREPIVPVLSEHKKYTAPSMPTLGYFEAGDYVHNTNLNIAGTAPNQRVVKGWYRLTTGNGHVEGVDWVRDMIYFGIIS